MWRSKVFKGAVHVPHDAQMFRVHFFGLGSLKCISTMNPNLMTAFHLKPLSASLEPHEFRRAHFFEKESQGFRSLKPVTWLQDGYAPANKCNVRDFLGCLALILTHFDFGLV